MSEPYRRFLAMGDSICEGVGDVEPRCPNGVRGWADRVAEAMAQRDPEFRYANLAIRGRLLPVVLDEQMPKALELRPDLVAICAGANDMARPQVDIDDLVARLDDAMAQLTAAGARVLTFSTFDTGGRAIFSALRGRFAIFNELLREVVERHDAILIDFWRMREFRERSMWEFDRLHMSPLGHEHMAMAVLDAIGVDHGWMLDAAPPTDMTAAQRRKDNRQWAVQAAIPWVGRRIRGVSTGDPLAARYPGWTTLEPAPVES